MPDRENAGRQLANQLSVRWWSDPVVLGLVRGGVAVGLPVAEALNAPLDVAVVRKIGAPSHPEFGVGAVTADGPPIYDAISLRHLRLDERDLEPVCAREQAEAQRRLRVYRECRPGVDLSGRDVIVVDDGIATGVSARAALRGLRLSRPARLILAAPVCAREAASALAADADELVVLQQPPDLGAIGLWYDDFRQLSDDDVLTYLERARQTITTS